MNKSGKIAIIGGVVILLVFLLYYFGFKQHNEPAQVDDWTMSYDPESKAPYGTYTLKELLDTTGLFGNFLELNQELDKTLEDDPAINDIYFFIGSKNYLSDSSAIFLLDFVKKGNTAFISTENFPSALMREICYDSDYVFEDEFEDTTQFFKFYHPQLASKRYQFDFRFYNKTERKKWSYFDLNAFELATEEDLTKLGSNTQDKCNFLKIRYGSGYLFLHSAPFVFTNICVFKRDGFQYAENVLKHIPPGRVQWDKYNIQYRNPNRNNEPGTGAKRESVLQFVMNNPPLLWAFLILLCGAVLYALFKGKRMQKIVPAAESKKNLSLQYIQTLSSLYLQEKKHNKLIKLKEKTFLNFIANRYYIHSNKPDNRFIEKLAIKSHVDKSIIESIFKSFEILEKTVDVTDQQLIDLHRKIEHFYKICR